MKRELKRIIPSVATSDGAGVKLRRSIGSADGLRLDPFLMLDEFGTDRPEDYIAGFPPHPHRGFETVTYMIDGHMRHEDHLGNVGELKSGGVQWMTAGRGVIHSEMPQQEEGRMRGFQLWINLPAAEKMKPAAYQDITADQVTQKAIPGGNIRLIAGQLPLSDEVLRGPINPEPGSMSTDPLFVDITLKVGSEATLQVPRKHNAFVYVYEGSLDIGGRPLQSRQAGILGEGTELMLRATADLRAILVAGHPIGEPIVQYGPFVMNTREEIEQALSDYRSGTLTN